MRALEDEPILDRRKSPMQSSDADIEATDQTGRHSEELKARSSLGVRVAFSVITTIMAFLGAFFYCLHQGVPVQEAINASVGAAGFVGTVLALILPNHSSQNK